MKRKTVLTCIICVIFFAKVFAQDTITVMTYNLLNFNNFTSYCTNSNNPFNPKKEFLKTICNYVKPDILGLNEVGANNANIQFILDSILNGNVPSKIYARISYINSSNTDIVSTIFFNTNKFALYETNFLQTSLRDVIIATLFYKSKELVNHQDTVFIRNIVAHLKAGSTSADQQQRAQETQIIMNYLNSIGNIKNTLLMGDLNVYSSTEQAFQNIINYSNPAVRLYDPVNKLGNWHDNSAFALYHTQAAQVNSNGCTTGGGLDDRFDFILTSFGILNNLNKVQYLNNSYKTIGQDGNRFNMGIDNPENYSVPSNVLHALANMSDHLPVTLKLVIHQTPLIGIEENMSVDDYIQVKTWQNHQLVLLSKKELKGVEINIFDVLGKKIYKNNISYLNGEIKVNTPNFSQGIYLIVITCNQKINYYKIFKN